MKNEILRFNNVYTDDNCASNLKNFNLSVYSGEVLGLVSIDDVGLGKLFELLQKNTYIKYGTIYMNDTLINSYKYSDYSNVNIFHISNESKLCDNLNVFENIVLSKQKNRLLNYKKEDIQIEFNSIREELNINYEISPCDMVYELSSADKIVVSLLKAYYNGFKLILINNVDNILDIEEISRIKELIDSIKKRDVSIIYIGINYKKIFLLSDCVGIMQKGRIIKYIDINNFSEKITENYFRNLYAEKNILNKKNGDKLKFIFNEPNELLLEIIKGSCNIIVSSNKRELEFGYKVLVEKKSKLVYTDKKCEKLVIGKNLMLVDGNNIENNIYMNLSYLDNLYLSYNKKKRGIIKRKSINTFKKTYNINDSENINFRNKEDIYKMIFKKIIIVSPKVIILIEPLANCTIKLKNKLLEYIRSFISIGITVIIFTLNITELTSIADKIQYLRMNNSDMEFC